MMLGATDSMSSGQETQDRDIRYPHLPRLPITTAWSKPSPSSNPQGIDKIALNWFTGFEVSSSAPTPPLL